MIPDKCNIGRLQSCQRATESTGMIAFYKVGFDGTSWQRPVQATLFPTSPLMKLGSHGPRVIPQFHKAPLRMSHLSQAFKCFRYLVVFSQQGPAHSERGCWLLRFSARQLCYPAAADCPDQWSGLSLTTHKLNNSFGRCEVDKCLSNPSILGELKKTYWLFICFGMLIFNLDIEEDLLVPKCLQYRDFYCLIFILCFRKQNGSISVIYPGMSQAIGM